MGSILMNLATNVFSLGNAATPLGIKAMQDLQTLNTTEDTATDSMCMFLAINTSSVTLIPATTIAYRVAAGSTNAVEIIGPTLFATIVSTTVAVIAAKVMSRMRRFRATKPDKACAGPFGTQARNMPAARTRKNIPCALSLFMFGLPSLLVVFRNLSL